MSKEFKLLMLVIFGLFPHHTIACFDWFFTTERNPENLAGDTPSTLPLKKRSVDAGVDKDLLSSGRMLLIGGGSMADDGRPLTTVELVSTTGNCPNTTVPPLPAARAHPATALYTGEAGEARVMACGGSAGWVGWRDGEGWDRSARRECWSYGLGEEFWRREPDLMVGVSGGGLWTVNDRLHAAGPEAGRRVQRLRDGRWEAVGKGLELPREMREPGQCTAAWGTTVLAAEDGGVGYHTTVGSGKWSKLPELPNDARRCTVAVIGGKPSFVVSSDQLVSYLPLPVAADSRWTTLPRSDHKRAVPTLPVDGRLTRVGEDGTVRVYDEDKRDWRTAGHRVWEEGERRGYAAVTVPRNWGCE